MAFLFQLGCGSFVKAEPQSMDDVNDMVTPDDDFVGDSKKKLSYSAAHPLYLSDQSRYEYSQVNQALDKAFSYKKPVLFFIHGRGNEPNKSLNGGTFVEGNAVHKLEEQYGVKVVMFNWESEAFLKDRTKPLSHMAEAAASLQKVLISIESYLKANPNKKISLLAQSMGSIVVQTNIEKYGWSFKKKIFSNVILTSPDANNVNHHKWLDKISNVEKVYVSINKDDDILEQSTDERPKGVSALGLNPVKPYAAAATYLDLTKMGSKAGQATGVHEVFNKPNMKGQRNVCEIFQALLSSDVPNLSKSVTTTADKNYLKFVFNINENIACFKF